MQPRWLSLEKLLNRGVQKRLTTSGYHGSGISDIQVLIAEQKRSVLDIEKRWMERHNSLEPIIVHLKSDGKIKWSILKGTLSDALNVILSACGQILLKLDLNHMALPSSTT